MSLFDILARYGTAALLRFLALVLAFLTLAALRTSIQLVVSALTALMRGIDRAVATRIADPVPPHARATWSKGATA